MKALLRKIPMVLLMIWPYSMFFFAFLPDEGNIDTYVFVYGTGILCILSIINAIIYKGKDVPKNLAFWSMLIKIVHIPFYVFMFIGALLMIPSAMLTILVVVAPAVYLLIFLVDYVFLVSSSAYSIKAIWSAKKQGKMHVIPAIILTVCSFIFVTDIISTIVLYVMMKKGKK